MCFLSVQDCSLVLPVVQCLKTAASYILSSFIVVYGGGDGNLISVTPSGISSKSLLSLGIEFYLDSQLSRELAKGV